MAKIISLSAFLGCILLVRAEPQVNTGYSISGENNGFDYNSNIINGGYVAGKEGHRESTDFYSGGSGGHSLANGRSQGNLEESLRSTSYSGFSPSTHNSGFSSGYSSNRENLPSSSYFGSNGQTNYDNYGSSTTTGDSPYDSAYTQASDQVGSDFNQFSATKHKNPSFVRYSDNLPGATGSTGSTGNYPELSGSEGSFRGEFSGDAFRNHAPHTAAFVDSEQNYNRETTGLFSNSDYSYGKQKESSFGMGGGSNKFMNDMYAVHPERYVRGNHGGVAQPGRDYASSMFLPSSGNGPFSSVRGSVYGSGKFSKYNKHSGDYPSGGLNYLSKEQDLDYLLSSYGKGSGKLVTLKEGRPSSYGGPYAGGPSYLSKVMGGYKSKPSFISSYPNSYSSSPVGYSPMSSSLHGSFSGNSYADGPLLRRYRSSSYPPPPASVFSGFF